MSKLSIISELWQFLRIRKKSVAGSDFSAIIILGGLIILTQGSALAPFIYSIF